MQSLLNVNFAQNDEDDPYMDPNYIQGLSVRDEELCGLSHNEEDENCEFVNKSGSEFDMKFIVDNSD